MQKPHGSLGLGIGLAVSSPERGPLPVALRFSRRAACLAAATAIGDLMSANNGSGDGASAASEPSLEHAFHMAKSKDRGGSIFFETLEKQ